MARRGTCAPGGVTLFRDGHACFHLSSPAGTTAPRGTVTPEPHGAVTWAPLCLEGAGWSHHCLPQDPWRGLLVAGPQWAQGEGTCSRAERHRDQSTQERESLSITSRLPGCCSGPPGLPLQQRQGSGHLTTLTWWLMQGLRDPIRRSLSGVPSTRPSLPKKGLFRQSVFGPVCCP